MSKPLTKAAIQRVVKALPELMSGRAFGGPVPVALSEGGDLQELLRDYFRVMEIAHILRRGGVKAMIYRLETGKTRVVPSDCFDEAHQRLAANYRNVYSPDQLTEPCLLEELKEIGADEEQAVAEALPQLDALLLAYKRECTHVDELQL